MNITVKRHGTLFGPILFVVAFMAAMLLLTPVSSADDGQSLEVSLTNTATPGTVDVMIDYNPGIMSLKLSIDYDSSAMTLKEVIDGDILMITASNLGKLPYTVYGEGSDPMNAATTTGRLVTLIFELKEGLDAGQYPVYVKAIESIDGSLEPLSVNAVSGVISTGILNLGDVDGNGKINSVDSLKLRRYLAEDDTVSIVASNSDLNGDGKINSVDSLLLRRYLAGNDVVFSGSAGDSTVTIDNRGTVYPIKGVTLEKPLFVRVSDSAYAVTILGNGTVENMGDGLYRIILNEDGCTISISEGLSVHKIVFVVDGIGYGTVDKTVVDVADGTTWSVSGNVLTFSDGQTVTATASADTNQYAYIFNNWSAESGTVSSDIGISAMFDRTVKEYTVSFTVDDVSKGDINTPSVTVPYGTTWSVSKNVLTFSDGQKVTANVKPQTVQYTFSFSSWSKASGTVTSDMSVQASFTSSLRNYTVSVTTNNTSYGNVSPGSVSVPYGTTWSVSGNVMKLSDGTDITATPKAKTAQCTYSFSSWSKTSGTVTSDMSVQAVFTSAVRQYTVTFHSDGDILSSVKCEYGKTVDAPAVPVKEGYMFTGWYTDVGCTTTFNISTSVTKNLNLYAGWSKIIEHHVTFDYNDGTNRYVTISADNGSKIDVPSDIKKLYRPGYGYVSAWYTDISCTEMWDFNADTVAEDMVLYAGWVSMYATVKFYVDGAEYDSLSTLIGKGIGADIIMAPTKNLHTFVGWYTDISLTSGWDIVKDVVTGDMKLYASFISDIEYRPSFSGEKFYAGEYTISGVTYYLVYDGTMKDVIVANLYDGKAIKVTSASNSFEYTTQIVKGKEVSNTIGFAYNREDTSSWNSDVSASVSLGIEAGAFIKAKLDTTIESSLGYGGTSTEGRTHSYGHTSIVSYSESNSTKVLFNFDNFDVGKYVTFAILGNVDVFTAYYVDSKGSLQYTMVYNSYELHSEFVQFDEYSGYNVSFDMDPEYKLTGKGTSSEPFRVNTPLDIQMIHKDEDANYVLENDLDLSDIIWAPITFYGVFDGNGKTIKNLKVSSCQNLHSYWSDNIARIGLFGYTSGATIKDLTIADSSIEAKNCKLNHRTGFIVANAYGDTSITGCNVVNCFADTHYGREGGICGAAENNTVIRGCTVKDTSLLGMHAPIGGMVGTVYHSSVVVDGCNLIECTLASTDSTIGGIVGDLSGSVINCNVNGGTLRIDNDGGADAYGGIAGAGFEKSSVKSCKVTSMKFIINIIHSQSRIGFIVGHGKGSISEVTATDCTYEGFDKDHVSSLWNGRYILTAGDGHRKYGWPVVGLIEGSAKISVKSSIDSNHSGYIPIDNVYGLYRLKDEMGSKYYLTSDIDLNGYGWNEPIPDWFWGVFDGNGKTIKNLSMDTVPFGRYAERWGFFNGVSGTVKNLTIEGNLYFHTNSKDKTNWNVFLYAGLLTGILSGKDALITNCVSKGKVFFDTGIAVEGCNLGGMVGIMGDGAKMTYCTNNAEVYAHTYTVYNGGLVGTAKDATIDHCTNHGYVHGWGNSQDAKTYISTGGIVGETYGNVWITNCSNDATVYSDHAHMSPIREHRAYVGGIVGWNSGELHVDNCWCDTSKVIMAHPGNGKYVGDSGKYVGNW